MSGPALKGWTSCVAWVGGVVIAACLAAPAHAQSGFLGGLFQPPPEEAAPGPSREPPPPPPASANDAPAPRPAAKPKPVRKQIVRAPLPPPRPWGALDAPEAEAEVTAPESDQTASIPAPARPSAELAAPSASPSPEPPAEDAPPPVVAQAPAPVVAAPPVAAAAPPVEPECRAILLVRKGEWNGRKLDGLRVARGKIDDSDVARGILDDVPGVSMRVQDIDWTAGLLSLASGEVDGVLVGVNRIRVSDLQNVWLGHFQLLQLPLRKLDGRICPLDSALM